MTSVFGVHIGNSSASLACFKDGKVDVIANDAGYRVTPAVVSFLQTEEVTGLEAKAALLRNKLCTVSHNKLLYYEEEIKTLINKSEGKIIEEDKIIKYKLSLEEGQQKIITPDQVSTSLYKSMLKIAESASKGQDSYKAVLTVPFNWSEESIERTRKAAVNAGFNVLQLISEPSAAVLAYQIGIQDPLQVCTCLVYHLGGISANATIVKVAGAVYSIEQSVESKSIGGDKLNTMLADYIADEFHRKFKLDPRESRRSMAKLINHAENLKHILSNLGSADCFVESLHEGIDFRLNISRARFELMMINYLQECLEPINKVLLKSNIKSSDITHVVFCGGSLKIPKLQKLISDMFSNAEILNKINPDEVLAVGAALQASYLPDTWDNLFKDMSITVSALSKSIFVKSSVSKDWFCMISENSAIPFIKQQKFITNDETFSVEIAEQTNKPDELNLLGKVELTELKKNATIILELKWTSMGLHISLADQTNKRSVIEISTGE